MLYILVYAQHSRSDIIHSTFCNYSFYVLHAVPCILHSRLYILHSTILYSIFYILNYTLEAMETLNLKKGILPVSCALHPFLFFCTPCLRGSFRFFCFFWLLTAKTLALVLCTLVFFCTFSSPVLVDFCLIWAICLYFCFLFGSFWTAFVRTAFVKGRPWSPQGCTSLQQSRGPCC